ncbi:TM2 domain-containing protein [Lysinibacillus fusiformis]
MYDGIDSSWPIKSKGLAGFLAIFFGGIGIHKFYLGKIFQGILYLVFCWTYIPVIISFIEGIIYLLSSEHNFSVKHKVRTR